MSQNGQQKVIESTADFKSGPAGEAARWAVEIEGAKKNVKKWHKQARDINKRFLDDRAGSQKDETRLNLFTANVQTQRALMFGKEPKVDVRRRFDDHTDQIGRVCALMLERLLNTDVVDGTDGYRAAIGHALDDDLTVGMGSVRLRYEAQFKDQPYVEPVTQADPETGEEVELAPGYQPEPAKVAEDVKCDYVHWRDQLWSPARTFSEVRWWAFRAYLTKDQVTARFGAKHAKKVPYKKNASAKDDVAESLRNDPWQRAEVWEIWSKEDEKVYWYCEGYDQILDSKPDPLGLDGFWPFPAPLMANLTSDEYLPRPDFLIAQDIYDEIDLVSTRITHLERAVKVVGAYDKSNEGVRRILSEGFDNDLVPVDNWAMFAERGGVDGAISWLPVDKVVGALDKLRDYRGELVKMLYEVTGMSDIMRGTSNEKGVTATEQALKAKFASVRMQYRQDRFARFATEALRIKAEIILKHFDADQIILRSNIEATPDNALAQQAVQLLRDERSKYKIEVKPESVSLTDFAALRDERMSFIQAIGQFLQAAGPMLQVMPESAPFLFQTLQWTAAGFRGGEVLEGVLDQAMRAAEQARIQAQNAPPQPDPKVQALEKKAEIESQGMQQKFQLDAASKQLDIQHKQQVNQMDLQKRQQDAALHNRAQIEQFARGLLPGVPADQREAP